MHASPQPVKTLKHHILTQWRKSDASAEFKQSVDDFLAALPLVTSLIAPLSTLYDIPGLTQRWYTFNGEEVSDPPANVALSAVGELEEHRVESLRGRTNALLIYNRTGFQCNSERSSCLSFLGEHEAQEAGGIAFDSLLGHQGMARASPDESGAQERKLTDPAAGYNCCRQPMYLWSADAKRRVSFPSMTRSRRMLTHATAEQGICLQHRLLVCCAFGYSGVLERHGTGGLCGLYAPSGLEGQPQDPSSGTAFRREFQPDYSVCCPFAMPTIQRSYPSYSSSGSSPSGLSSSHE